MGHFVISDFRFTIGMIAGGLYRESRGDPPRPDTVCVMQGGPPESAPVMPERVALKRTHPRPGRATRQGLTWFLLCKDTLPEKMTVCPGGSPLRFGRILVVIIPHDGIVFDIPPDIAHFALVADDVFVVVSLPDGRAGIFGEFP